MRNGYHGRTRKNTKEHGRTWKNMEERGKTCQKGKNERMKEKIAETDELEEAICRVSQMEILFDKVSAAVKNMQGSVENTLELQEAVSALRRYLDSGNWLHDYEMDEQKRLPSDLKRGVLSQDGLCNLLCELRKQ